MIKNLWSRIKIFCGNEHEELTEMELFYGGKTPYYTCPKKFPEKRNENERECVNRLNLDDYEGLVSKFAKLISASEENFEQIDFTNYEFDYLGPRAKIHVKVLKYTNEDIHLGILNQTVFKQR